jgi:aryl-alcohol dehydrogenase-like predicted oxidoreductase
MGFGAMRLPQTGQALTAGAATRDRAQAIAVLRRAVELGVNHIDTGAFYFSPLRSANELINSALAPYPDDLVIVTKVGPARDPSGQWAPAATPEQLRGQVEENLRQLGRDYLDVVNLRVMPAMTSLTDYFGALASLRQAGLIRHLGVSGVTPEQLAEAQAVAPVVCVQNRYFLGASAEEHGFVDACGEQGVAFVPFFSIAGTGRGAGVSGASGEYADVLAIARAHGATAAQVRLAWTLQRGPHMLVIPGTGDPGHLAANVAAGALRLTAGEVARLTSLQGPDGDNRLRVVWRVREHGRQRPARGGGRAGSRRPWRASSR